MSKDIFLIARQRKAGTLDEHEVYPDDQPEEQPEQDSQSAALLELAEAIKTLAGSRLPEMVIDTAPIAEVMARQSRPQPVVKKKWEFVLQRDDSGYLEKIIAREI